MSEIYPTQLRDFIDNNIEIHDFVLDVFFLSRFDETLTRSTLYNETAISFSLSSELITVQR